MRPTRGTSSRSLRSGGVFYGGLIAATTVAIWYMRKQRPAGLAPSPTWARRRSRSARRSGAGAASRRAAATARRATARSRSRSRTRSRTKRSARPLNVPLHPDADLPVAQRLPDLPDPPVGLPPQDLRRRGLLALRAPLRHHARNPRDLARRPRARLRDSRRPLDLAVHRARWPPLLAGGMLFYLSRRSRAEALGLACSGGSRSDPLPPAPGSTSSSSAACSDLSRSRIQKLIAEGAVRVGGAPARRSHVVRAGEEVSIEVPEPRRDRARGRGHPPLDPLRGRAPPRDRQAARARRPPRSGAPFGHARQRPAAPRARPRRASAASCGPASSTGSTATPRAFCSSRRPTGRTSCSPGRCASGRCARNTWRSSPACRASARARSRSRSGATRGTARR